jgi:hypothetical protein
MSYVSGRLFTGSLTGITTTNVVLHPTQNCREVMIQADPTNAGNLLVGTIINQFIVLTPGQAITLPVISLNLIYVKMSSGTGIANWLARD